ncbi:MAG: general stress protein CsbD [Bacteroidetes bacterium]|nr:general stress protein CsbD [Bacteroidota bacterium]MDA1120181.1 general stress protein CsbD [Bacteroidota bacterium]
MRSWREQKVMLKWRFPNLSDEDFVFELGDKENMLTKLGIKLNKTRTELDLLFAELQRY